MCFFLKYNAQHRRIRCMGSRKAHGRWEVPSARPWFSLAALVCVRCVGYNDGGAHAVARLSVHSVRFSPEPWRRNWKTGIVTARGPYERGCFPLCLPARAPSSRYRGAALNFMGVMHLCACCAVVWPERNKLDKRQRPEHLRQLRCAPETRMMHCFKSRSAAKHEPSGYLHGNALFLLTCLHSHANGLRCQARATFSNTK